MSEPIVCQHIRVSGVVQGVGFRPFVWRLARELGLRGWQVQSVESENRGFDLISRRPHPDVGATLRIGFSHDHDRGYGGSRAIFD